jgi:hypothetical protein
MSNSMQIIHDRVLKIHNAKEIVNVHVLATQLHGDCSDLTIEQMRQSINKHVVLFRGTAVWHKTLWE